MSTPFQLHNKVAIITGGASGIGEETCRVFTAAGARVVIVDVNESAASALAAQLPGARAAVCDITNPAAVQQLFDSLERVDILINNAGIGLVGNIEETSLDDFQRLFRVNVDGVFLMTKAAVPKLIESHGVIVNIGSVASLVGVKRRYAYCATKGAVLMMTKQLAVDYPTQFRVNCIAPGTVHTPFVEAYLDKYHKHEKDKVRLELNARQPIGRLGQPVEIAHLALYLASDEAAFVNGAVFSIDGGWSAA